MSYVVAMRWCNALLATMGAVIATWAPSVWLRLVAAACAGWWLWRLGREWHDPNV